ncbi:DNA-binding response regulator [Cohnella endophytica]|uniref:DNA-binding response regulator n=1 Tax=Cohnella endophytica TaxID=2419778 RepID=A0A494XH66_9BACL|nr:DNA-binding response regulator [Cohnella endophytica]RKP47956.1 DNA-binding response regulator [Cohnella endophytica]
MDFNTAYEAFLSKHRISREGERLRRLNEGHGHLEKLILENVWWPAIGHFDDLHPEYEVSDFRDGARFLDFAWLPGPIRLNIEGDGFDTHARKVTLSGFDDDRIRQNHLIIDGWKVLRFSHNMVKERPRLCQQMLLQFMGTIYGMRTADDGAKARLSSEEKEIVRHALRVRQPMHPKDVSQLLHVEAQKARKLLHGLVKKEVLMPAGSGMRRINTYRLTPSVKLDDLDL